MEAGFSLARFDSSPWIGEVDVPHAVVVTTRDAMVVPARQRRLVAALPNPSVHDADIDHTGCVTRPAIFVPVLLDALAAVARRERRLGMNPYETLRSVIRFGPIETDRIERRLARRRPRWRICAASPSGACPAACSTTSTVAPRTSAPWRPTGPPSPPPRSVLASCAASRRSRSPRPCSASR